MLTSCPGASSCCAQAYRDLGGSSLQCKLSTEPLLCDTTRGLENKIKRGCAFIPVTLNDEVAAVKCRSVTSCMSKPIRR